MALRLRDIDRTLLVATLLVIFLVWLMIAGIWKTIELILELIV